MQKVLAAIEAVISSKAKDPNNLLVLPGFELEETIQTIDYQALIGSEDELVTVSQVTELLKKLGEPYSELFYSHYEKALEPDNPEIPAVALLPPPGLREACHDAGLLLEGYSIDFYNLHDSGVANSTIVEICDFWDEYDFSWYPIYLESKRISTKKQVADAICQSLKSDHALIRHSICNSLEQAIMLDDVKHFSSGGKRIALPIISLLHRVGCGNYMNRYFNNPRLAISNFAGDWEEYLGPNDLESLCRSKTKSEEIVYIHNLLYGIESNYDFKDVFDRALQAIEKQIPKTSQRRVTVVRSERSKR